MTKTKWEWEYEVVSICNDAVDTENKLNNWARKGWKVICSYAFGRWFVLGRRRREELNGNSR